MNAGEGTLARAASRLTVQDFEWLRDNGILSGCAADTEDRDGGCALMSVRAFSREMLPPGQPTYGKRRPGPPGASQSPRSPALEPPCPAALPSPEGS